MPCRKVRYRDAIAAKLALSKVARQDKAHRPKTERRAYRPKTERRAYLCPTCHGWHLTSKGHRRAA